MTKTFNLSFEIPWDGLEIYYDEFLATRFEELIIIENSLTTLDFKTIDEFAHKWKGFADPYGFGVLGQLAILIEAACESKDVESCRSLFTEVKDYLNSKIKSKA